MTTLPEILKTKISTSGPINIEDYMSTCLYHEEHGYYMTQTPFGREGDFKFHKFMVK